MRQRGLGKRVYVAGHNGMVGSAIWRALSQTGYQYLIGRTSSELDLRNQYAVRNFFLREKPDVVVVAAARVGGILANDSFPYQFLMDNLLIQNNLIQAAHESNVENLVFLGSSCVYPKLASQPLKEEYLLSGPLEPTNEWYAVAKIAGLKSCEAIRKQYNKSFVSLMPTNLYGPNDNFDLNTSHVLPAMIRKFHIAKEKGNLPVVLWGTGNPKREFLHVDDLAQAVLFSIENELPDSLYNVGTGNDLAIRDLAGLIQKITGHKGEIIWDYQKPDGTPRKLLDISKLAKLGWEYRIDLESGIKRTYDWFLHNQENLKNVKIYK